MADGKIETHHSHTKLLNPKRQFVKAFRTEERHEGFVVRPDLKRHTYKIVGKTLAGPGESQGLFLNLCVALLHWCQDDASAATSVSRLGSKRAKIGLEQRAFLIALKARLCCSPQIQ